MLLTDHVWTTDCVWIFDCSIDLEAEYPPITAKRYRPAMLSIQEILIYTLSLINLAALTTYFMDAAK